MSKKHEPTKPKEEIAFGPEVAPGVRLALRRHADGEMQEVLVRSVRDGEPLLPGAEVAIVGAPSCGCEGGHRHELTPLYKYGAERAIEGPAQVATPAYREGHDRIFGKKTLVGLA